MKNLPLLLKTAKKLTKYDSSGNLTRIGFDPKIDSGFGFPLWVKYFGKDIISKNGLKAQINTPQAVAGAEHHHGDHQRRGWLEQVRRLPQHVRLLRRKGNPLVKDQLGFWPMESFIYNMFSNNSPNVNIAAAYFTNAQGRPDHVLQR